MNSFMTGASGFIGLHLLHELVKQGDTVHVLVRRPLQTSSHSNGNVVPHYGTLENFALLCEAMKGCSRVFHVAAYARNWARHNNLFFEVNVQGTDNVMRAAVANGVQRVLCTSSVLALGFANGSPLTEDATPPRHFMTTYAESKQNAEAVALDYCNEHLDVVVVNPTRVYGPGLLSEGNSVTRMIKLHLAGRFPLILGDGSAIGNYVHVRDVVRGHLLAMTRGRTGERYILGGDNVSFNQFFWTIRRITEQRHLLARVPAPLALMFGQVEEWRAQILGGTPMISPGWVRTFLLDGSVSSAKAQRDLGYTITPLIDGLRETIRWLRSTDRKEEKTC
jgi:nucleoside-diphosphate-sugar epimerase